MPHFFVIRVKNNRLILPEFLAWQINQVSAQAYIKKSSVGSTVTNIRKDVLENLNVTIPLLETQKLIVKMAKAAFAEKRLLQELIRNREQQMQALASTLIFQKETYHG